MESWGIPPHILSGFWSDLSESVAIEDLAFHGDSSALKTPSWILVTCSQELLENAQALLMELSECKEDVDFEEDCHLTLDVLLGDPFVVGRRGTHSIRGIETRCYLPHTGWYLF